MAKDRVLFMHASMIFQYSGLVAYPFFWGKVLFRCWFRYFSIFLDFYCVDLFKFVFMLLLTFLWNSFWFIAIFYGCVEHDNTHTHTYTHTRYPSVHWFRCCCCCIWPLSLVEYDWPTTFATVLLNDELVRWDCSCKDSFCCCHKGNKAKQDANE